MNKIRQFADERKVYVALVGGAILGLIIGLVVGWWIWPVEWTDSTPANLHPVFQDAFVLYVVENYESNGGLEWATEMIAPSYWDEGELGAAFARVEEGVGGETLARLDILRQGLISEPEQPIEEPEAPDGEGSSTFDRLRPFLLVCGVALVVAAIVGGVILLFGRKKGDGDTREARGGDGPLGGDAETVFEPGGMVDTPNGEPQAQFVTSYSLGDDHYDPSFSIEIETGEFMGECGVGISDTLSSGEPSKVTAFEIWLFDKNDIRTVTKVLMSEYAYGDDALRTKLAPKGEPVLATVGDVVPLETKRLRVQARLLDLAYGDGDLPDNSYFARLTLDLTAWVKPSQQTEASATEESTLV